MGSSVNCAGCYKPKYAFADMEEKASVIYWEKAKYYNCHSMLLTIILKTLVCTWHFSYRW